MADSEYIVKELMKTSGKGPSYPVLIPNQKGRSPYDIWGLFMYIGAIRI